MAYLYFQREVILRDQSSIKCMIQSFGVGSILVIKQLLVHDQVRHERHPSVHSNIALHSIPKRIT